jgi:hypothetical protein
MRIAAILSVLASIVSVSSAFAEMKFQRLTIVYTDNEVACEKLLEQWTRTLLWTRGERTETIRAGQPVKLGYGLEKEFKLSESEWKQEWTRFHVGIVNSKNRKQSINRALPVVKDFFYSDKDKIKFEFKADIPADYSGDFYSRIRITAFTPDSDICQVEAILGDFFKLAP